MKTNDLLTVILGIGTIALGALVPVTAPYAIPTGVGLVMAGIPQVSALLEKVKPPTPKP